MATETLTGQDLGSEERCIALAREGDREAFGELVRRHRAATIDVVYRMCGDPFLAEDAAQQAFLRAWQRLDQFRPQVSFRAWLFRIAVNAALDMLRRARPEAELDEARELSAPERVDRTVEKREQVEAVRRAVMSLPEASRAVLILREYRGLAYGEIADALEIPIGTVMSRLSYARKVLAARWKAAGEDA